MDIDSVPTQIIFIQSFCLNDATVCFIEQCNGKNVLEQISSLRMLSNNERR